MSNSEKVRRYLSKHPNANAADVAEKFGISKPYVYVIKSKMKHEAEEVEEVEVVEAKEPSEPGTVVAVARAGTDVDATLAERGQRYGKFTGHARITQHLKQVMFANKLRQELDDDMVEALEMIAHKIGRIINGDPHYADSWRDIAGYAKLVSDRLETGREV